MEKRGEGRFSDQHPSDEALNNSVTLTYNGLGDLVTRTEDGTAIRYYYNYAIGLHPIVAEKNDSTGQFLRYYVWTPGGRLLYMIDAANSNKVEQGGSGLNNQQGLAGKKGQ